MFDSDSFLSTATEKATSTVFQQVPEGEYNAVVTALNARQFDTKNGTATVLDITWSIDDITGEVEKATGRKENSCRQTIWLDVGNDGGLETGVGKNIQLGRLREAVGQNKAGKTWSPQQLEGQVAKVLVTHSFDKEDDSIIYANVKRVTAA